MILDIKSNAKINIGLNIIKKREDGYHELDMIMAPIDLRDILKIKFGQKKGNLILTSNNEDVPCNEDNIVYKIYEKFYDFTGIEKEEISCHIEKNIPSQAGLGGGSSNGAFFLKALNTYHKEILSLEDMINISKNIGADIPFFLINKTARAEGIGEKLTVFENKLDKKLILIKPDFGINTGHAYGNIIKLKEKKIADIEKIINGLKENKVSLINENIQNSLQQASLIDTDELIRFEKEINKVENLKFYMSGSGSCYYSFVAIHRADEVYNLLRNKFKTYFVSLNSFL